MRLTTNPAWQPGDPLWLDSPVPKAPGYEYRRGGYSNYLFNLREDSALPYPGPDAARWPEPIDGRGLGDGDELGEFIRRVHRDRAHLAASEQQGAAS